MCFYKLREDSGSRVCGLGHFHWVTERAEMTFCEKGHLGQSEDTLAGRAIVLSCLQPAGKGSVDLVLEPPHHPPPAIGHPRP